MKNLFKVFVLIVLLTSCKKENINYSKVEEFMPAKANIPVPDPWNNWCKQKIAFYGDSFMAEIEGFPPNMPKFLISDLGIDSLLYTASGWGPYYMHGDSAKYNVAVSGATSGGIRQMYDKDTTHRDWATVIGAGRNNYYETETVLADIAYMVSHLKTDKFVVLSILPGGWEAEWKGNAGGNQINKLNGILHDTYGDHFIDQKPYLQSKRQNTYWDSMCVVHDVTPISLRTFDGGLDSLHVNKKGMEYEAEYIRKQLLNCN